MVTERSLTISIVNTREWEVLEACLASLFQNPYTLGPFEVIVLNNGSRSGSMEQISDRFPQVRIMEERRWRGFGANHNLVAGNASGDLLFILNPDALVHEDALDRLAAAFNEQPNIAVAAGPILNSDGSVWTDSPFPFPTPLRALGQAVGTHRLTGNKTGTKVAHTFSDGWVSGSAFMVDTSTFAFFDGFDERFFIYAEEIDLMLRLTRGGWKLAWVPDAYVTHTGRTAKPAEMDPLQPPRRRLEDYERRRIFQYVKSKTAYMAKHHGKPSALAYRMALGVDASIRLLLASIPPLKRLLEDHGPHPAVTRHHHLTKLRAALNPESGPSLAGLAADWNNDLARDEEVAP